MFNHLKRIDHLTSWIARAFYYPRLNLFLKQPDLLQDGFYVGGKMRNIAFQLVMLQCCKTSCTLFVARFTVP